MNAAEIRGAHQPLYDDFETRVRQRFADQKLMQTINAEINVVIPGVVTIELPFQAALTQHHGYIHAGVVTSIADTACGYAAMTLMAEDRDVLSVEFKINLLLPAEGERFIARASVKRSGRTLTICACDVASVSKGEQKVVASMLGTMIAVQARGSAKPLL